MWKDRVQNLVKENLVSIENQINHTLPIIFTFGTNPTPLMTRLSDELSLLSPMKKYLFIGIKYSGVKSKGPLLVKFKIL